MSFGYIDMSLNQVYLFQDSLLRTLFVELK